MGLPRGRPQGEWLGLRDSAAPPLFSPAMAELSSLLLLQVIRSQPGLLDADAVWEMRLGEILMGIRRRESTAVASQVLLLLLRREWKEVHARA